MDDVWIVNASPLITLAKAGHQELLLRQCRRLIIPDSVASEIRSGPSDDPARRLLDTGFGETASLQVAIPSVVLEWGLGSGESSVIALALHHSDAVAVLDDSAARHCARSFQVPLIGTLGVILRARRIGLIPNAAHVISDLRNSGLYLDSATINAALQPFGEIWKE